MNIKGLISQLLLVAVCVPSFGGCATIFSERTYPVTIDNSGGQTYFSVRNRKHQVVHEGVTPNQVVLEAKSHPFWPAKYDVTFVGSDNVIQQREVKAGVDPWLAANIINGGLVGLAVDGTTGAMFKLPERVIGDIPAQYALTDMNQGAQIASAHIQSASTPNQIGTLVEQVTYEGDPNLAPPANQ